MKNDERYPVRCRECGNVIAVRQGNVVISTLRHRNRRKEVRVRLESGQRVWIICDRCETENGIIGS